MGDLKKNELFLQKIRLSENVVANFFLSLQRQILEQMSYTKKPIVIDHPSENLLKTIKKLREHKLAELEKLRNMKPEEFSRRVIFV